MARSVVYAFEGAGLVKIGTTIDLAGRLRALQSGSPVELVVLGVLDGGHVEESALHAEFRASRRHGEWFDLGAGDRLALLSRLRPIGGFDIGHVYVERQSDGREVVVNEPPLVLD